ncbi:MIT domain-containing protein [Apiospora marii]|uniref:MIT domain-containing protein n=1 Tax=Apiospora marii TaxID=335849 RepID=A0ABR1RL73_9PEZI
MAAPFPGFEELKLVVFATALPSDDYHRLAGLAGLPGLCSPTGFLGSLCSSVFPDRLRQEHGASIITEPFPARTTTRRNRALQAVRGRDGDDAEEHLGRVTERREANRDEQESAKCVPRMSVIKYRLPTAQLAAGWKRSGLVKLPLLVNKEPVDAINHVLHTSQAEQLGRQWVNKFKEQLQRQVFEVIIQAA